MRKVILHIIHLECDKKSKQFDITGRTNEYIRSLIDRYQIKGKTFSKIVEYD